MMNPVRNNIQCGFMLYTLVYKNVSYLTMAQYLCHF